MGQRACIEPTELWKLAVEDEGQAEDRMHIERCRRCRLRFDAIREQTQLICAAASVDDAPRSIPSFERFLEGGRHLTPLSHGFPRQVGRYLILQELDSGGQSVVYRGWDPLFRRPVAVKLTSEWQEQFAPSIPAAFDEPVLLAEFRHKNLVEVFDCGTVGGRPYIVMELVEGRTLREVAFAGTLPAKEIRRIMVELAAVVAQAHEHRIVHLDLKPENVMVDDAGNVKLIDFGLALSFGRHSRSTADIRGTPEYMSPEQLRGDVREFGPATDVFGLGAVLYFLMTGNTLFEGNIQDDQQTRRALEKACHLLKDTGHTRGMVSLCRTALAADPRMRFKNGGEFLAALARVETSSRRIKWGLLLTGLTFLVVIAASIIGPPNINACNTASPSQGADPSTVLHFLKPDVYVDFSARLPRSEGAGVFLWSITSKTIPFNGPRRPVAGAPETCCIKTGPAGFEVSCRAGPVVAIAAAANRLGASTLESFDHSVRALDSYDWLGRTGIVRISNDAIRAEGEPLTQRQQCQSMQLQRALNRYGVRFAVVLVSVPKSTGSPRRYKLALDVADDVSMQTNGKGSRRLGIEPVSKPNLP